MSGKEFLYIPSKIGVNATCVPHPQAKATEFKHLLYQSIVQSEWLYTMASLYIWSTCWWFAPPRIPAHYQDESEMGDMN